MKITPVKPFLKEKLLELGLTKVSPAPDQVGPVAGPSVLSVVDISANVAGLPFQVPEELVANLQTYVS